jgi:integrase-recombinase protein
VQDLQEIKLSKEQKSYKKIFSLNEIQRCLKINKEDTKEIKLYKKILLFYATTGIRATEIYQLKQNNTDLFVIGGKGNKNRQICYIEYL